MAAKDEKDDEDKKPETENKEEGEASSEEGLHPPVDKAAKKKKMIIAGVAGIVLWAGIGAGLFFSGVLGSAHPPAEGAAQEKAAGTEAHAPAKEAGHSEEKAAGAPVFFNLGDILVNLAGDGKRPNFLKIKISLELSDEKDKAALDLLKPRVIDHFQLYLRELRIEDLRGSAGLQRLREELLLRVTEIAAPVRIRDVLFQEMLVQ